MPRLARLSVVLLFSVPVVVATHTSAQTRPAEPQLRTPVADAPMLPGFHPSTTPEQEAPRPVLTKVHGRPPALTPNQISGYLPKLGLRFGPVLPAPFVQTIKYQLESYSTTFGAEVNTTTAPNATFYGATGYVQVDFNVVPGKQVLLDCSLGEDGTYKLATMFLLVNNGNTAWLDGTLSSFNNHLLIPMNPAPGNAQFGRVVIHFTEIEFYGCQVDTVS